MNKRFIKLFLLGIVVLSVTGCDKKANQILTCNYTINESILSVEQTLNLTIKNGTFQSAKLENDLIYSDAYIGTYDENYLIDSLKTQFNTYKQVDITPTDKGANVTIELDIDEFSKLSNVSKDALSNIMEDDIPEIKEELEEANYVCNYS